MTTVKVWVQGFCENPTRNPQPSSLGNSNRDPETNPTKPSQTRDFSLLLSKDEARIALGFRVTNPTKPSPKKKNKNAPGLSQGGLQAPHVSTGLRTAELHRLGCRRGFLGALKRLLKKEFIRFSSGVMRVFKGFCT